MKNENLIVVLMLTTVLFLVIAHLSENNLEFSRYNTNWNGTSGFFNLPDRHSTMDIMNTSSLPGRENSLLLIIAPRNMYTENELANYRAFIREGNTLFLADDFGTGNTLLQGIGSSILIIPGILASVDRAYNDTYAIVTYPEYHHQITRNITSLVLDKGAALEGGEPLMKTSLMSWIDTDHNGRITKKEMLGKYTVLTSEPIGKGEVIVLSDPSVFINAMGTLDMKWGNRVFINNIITSKKNLLIDQSNSRTADTNGYSTIMQNMRSEPLSLLLFVAVLLFALILGFQKKIL